MSVAPQPALTVRQLAAYLSVNEKTVYRGTRREETPLLVLNAGGVVAHIFAAALAVFFVLAAASTAQATPSFTGLSRGSGVSGDGTVVVGFTNRGGPQPFSAFIWDTANGMRELGEVLTALGLDLAG